MNPRLCDTDASGGVSPDPPVGSRFPFAESTQRVCSLLPKITPGPWDAYEYSDDSFYIETEGETGGDRQYVLELRPNSGTKEDDLQLILLAPEMAAALSEALDLLEEAYRHHHGPSNPWRARVEKLGAWPR